MAIVWWLARDKRLLGGWASGKLSQTVLGIACLAMAVLPVLWLLSK
jgi:hypothetical protein